MLILLCCFGVTLAAGLFFLLADFLRLPYLRTSKAMINTGRETKKAAKSLETYLLSLAIRLAPYIHMDDDRDCARINADELLSQNVENMNHADGVWYVITRYSQTSDKSQTAAAGNEEEVVWQG